MPSASKKKRLKAEKYVFGFVNEILPPLKFPCARDMSPLERADHTGLDLYFTLHVCSVSLSPGNAN